MSHESEMFALLWEKMQIGLAESPVEGVPWFVRRRGQLQDMEALAHLLSRLIAGTEPPPLLSRGLLSDRIQDWARSGALFGLSEATLADLHARSWLNLDTIGIAVLPDRSSETSHAGAVSSVVVVAVDVNGVPLAFQFSDPGFNTDAITLESAVERTIASALVTLRMAEISLPSSMTFVLVNAFPELDATGIERQHRVTIIRGAEDTVAVMDMSRVVERSMQRFELLQQPCDWGDLERDAYYELGLNVLRVETILAAVRSAIDKEHLLGDLDAN